MNIFVMNLNVGQLPWPLGIHGRKSRARTLVDKILMMDEDSKLPDIICLQELFSKTARKIVIKGLKDAYPYYYVDDSHGKYLVGVNSGLAIFSKHPIVNQTLVHYSVYRGVENFAKKGIMGVRLEVDKYDENNALYSSSLCVFTTHVQTGVGGEPCICKLFDRNNLPSDSLKYLQIEQACKVINEFRDEDDHLIFCGDFNINSSKKLYQEISDALGVDCCIYDSFESKQSNLQSSAIGEGKRIDYQFVSDDLLGESIIDSYFGPYAIVTDHYAIFGDYKIKQ